MLSTASASEVFSGDQNLASEGVVVENKVGFRFALAVVTPIPEKVLAKPFAGSCFQKRAGITWSVSMFSIGNGTAVLFNVVNFSLLIK